MVKLFGSFALNLVSNRVRRTFYAFEGWPHRLLRVLLGENAQTSVIAEFKRDYEAFQSLQAKDEKSKELKEILDRSPFLLPKVKQWVAAFTSTEWKCADKILELAAEKAGASASSLVCEEQIHYMKNCRRAKCAKRLQRPAKCMATAVGQQLLQKRFHYDAFPVVQAVGRKSARFLMQKE